MGWDATGVEWYGIEMGAVRRDGVCRTFVCGIGPRRMAVGPGGIG